MIPIHEVLARIRWDPAEAGHDHALGYLDKRAGELRFVPLRAAHVDADNPSLLAVVDETGRERTIPLHRVREVRRDGKTIWRREPRR